MDDTGHAQLCDFGLSLVIDGFSMTHGTSGMGYTARYSAPEVIRDEVKTVKTDVYAFGCTSIPVSRRHGIQASDNAC